MRKKVVIQWQASIFLKLSETSYTIHQLVLLHLTSPSYLIVTLVFLSVTVNYETMSVYSNNYRKGKPGYSQPVQLIKKNSVHNIIVKKKTVYYLLQNAALRGCPCEGSSLNIYSSFAMLCSWSVVVFCLSCILRFSWSTVLPANSLKTDVSDLKWCCFSMFLILILLFQSGVPTASLPSDYQISNQNI